MEVLGDERHQDIIVWIDSGRSFMIRRRSAFTEEILPVHFNKASKFSSFTRKLSRWGFSRLKKGPEAGAYFHPLFQRGNHKLLSQMSCQSGNAVWFKFCTSSKTPLIWRPFRTTLVCCHGCLTCRRAYFSQRSSYMILRKMILMTVSHQREDKLL
jgi:hypothetical protein